ncbi:porin [Psychroflexus maritimus]|uniref:Porin n=1 Tax=Psychroflexus maritimus TaxID=2714865 RepID=A0A967AGS5_9FLAO|nr:porin [Psychroflexus maritimus]NGZ89130.1 porin [Psychroflexus maritimus]
MRRIVKIFIFICSCQLTAQIEADSLSNDLRLSSLPYYNYGRGLGVTSKDSVFQMNLRFRMQNRASYYHLPEEDYDKMDAKIRRLRLRFDGFLGNPKFLYAIQLSFTSDDLGEFQENEERFNVIRDAVVMYRPDENWNIIFGQTKLPGNRQRVNSSGALQLTDRTINNASFNIDRDFGVQVHYIKDFQDKLSYNFLTAFSSGRGRNFPNEFDAGGAVTTKAELFPFGTFQKDGRYFEGDILREKRFKLMLSGAYHYNSNALRNRGQIGLDLWETATIRSGFIDVMFKYQGFAGMFAYMNRTSPEVFQSNPENINDQRFIVVGEGYDSQLSYVFPSNYEIIARYSKQNLASEIEKFVPSSNEIAIGLTRYFWEHAFKIQVEVNRREFLPINAEKFDEYYVRFQVEMGI